MIVERILPGLDLKGALEEIKDKNHLKSGIIISMVGSLTLAKLRMANGSKRELNGPFEIVSATGTIASNGIHVHIGISDSEGIVFGGHLIKGCKIHTTAEICILTSNNVFKRVFDQQTGYRELEIQDYP